MILEEAYKRLGLTPLDDFIGKAAGRIDHMAGIIRPGDYRQIGASTWMVVSAVLALTEGKDILLLAETDKEAIRLRDEVLRRADQLGLGSTSGPIETAAGYFTVGKGKLQWGRGNAGVAGRVGFRGKIFNNAEWKQRAIRQAKGPFAMIRHILSKGNGRYAAYAEGGEFLMDLTKDGATQIVRRDRSISTERWRVTEEWEEAIVGNITLRSRPESDIFR